MEKIVFTCESVTPIFMYGADGTTPELRPASIKGVMRFWWRAINGNLPLKELKEKEDEIFGSTEKKSSFSIKIRNDKFNGNNIKKNYKFKIEFLISSKSDFDLKSFFELVVILGGFGKSAKKINQGKIKIINIKEDEKEEISYKEPHNLEDILKLLQKFNTNFNIENHKIVSNDFKFNYPMVHEIFVENNTLNTKLKEEKIFKRSLDD